MTVVSHPCFQNLTGKIAEFIDIIKDTFKLGQSKFGVCPNCNERRLHLYNIFYEDLWVYCQQCGYKSFVSVYLQKTLLLPDLISVVAKLYNRDVWFQLREISILTNQYRATINNRFSSTPNILKYIVAYNRKQKDMKNKKVMSFGIVLYFLPGLECAILNINDYSISKLLLPIPKNNFLFGPIRTDAYELILTNSFLSYTHNNELCFVTPLSQNKCHTNEKFAPQSITEYFFINYHGCKAILQPVDYAKLLCLFEPDINRRKEEFKYIYSMLDRKSKKFFLPYLVVEENKKEATQITNKTESFIVRYADTSYEISSEGVTEIESWKKISNFYCKTNKIITYKNKTFYLVSFFYNSIEETAVISDETFEKYKFDKLCRKLILFKNPLNNKYKHIYVVSPKYNRVLGQLAMLIDPSIKTMKFGDSVFDNRNKIALAGNGVVMDTIFIPILNLTKKEITHNLFNYLNPPPSLVDCIKFLKDNNMGNCLDIIKKITGRICGLTNKTLCIVTKDENLIDYVKKSRQDSLEEVGVFMKHIDDNINIVGYDELIDLDSIGADVDKQKIWSNAIDLFLSKIIFSWQSDPSNDLTEEFFNRFWENIGNFILKTRRKTSGHNVGNHAFYRPIIQWEPQIFFY